MKYLIFLALLALPTMTKDTPPSRILYDMPPITNDGIYSAPLPTHGADTVYIRFKVDVMKNIKRI